MRQNSDDHHHEHPETGNGDRWPWARAGWWWSASCCAAGSACPSLTRRQSLALQHRLATCMLPALDNNNLTARNSHRIDSHAPCRQTLPCPRPARFPAVSRPPSRVTSRVCSSTTTAKPSLCPAANSLGRWSSTARETSPTNSRSTHHSPSPVPPPTHPEPTLFPLPRDILVDLGPDAALPTLQSPVPASTAPG